MTMTEAVEKLERVDDLFGEISTNLVHVCEELPSLELPKSTEERIVGFCCTFLERLVEEDRSIQRILNSVKGNVDRVPHTPCRAPDGAAQAIQKTVDGLSKSGIRRRGKPQVQLAGAWISALSIGRRHSKDIRVYPR